MQRRAASVLDFEVMFALHREVFRNHVEALWGTWDDAWQRDNFRRECSESTCEVILLENVTIGFIQYVDGPESIRVWNVAVRPEFTGRGVGTRLFRELQEQARSRGAELRLRVFPTNERAHRFYRKLGFQEVSRNRTGIELVWRAT